MLQCAQICKKARKLSPRDKKALLKEDVLAAAKWDTELQLAQTSQANPEVPILKYNGTSGQTKISRELKKSTWRG